VEPAVSWPERVRAVVESERFQRTIIAVIVVNAITLGLETSASMRAEYGTALHVVDRAALAIFVAELAVKLSVYRARFFRDPWNCFDFAIVGISLLPMTGALSVLRSLRILRALRLISTIPSMRRVVSALLGAMPGMASIFSLLALVLYVAGVMATKMFGSAAPRYFGDLGTSLFTLFQVMTGEAWPDVARDVMDEHPLAWIFFVLYILMSSFVVLNLFIAVVVSAMEEYEDEVHEEQEKEIEREIESTSAVVLAELRALRAEVRSLRAARDSGMAVHPHTPDSTDVPIAAGEPGPADGPVPAG
jgi:voltage-gated sodium channel